MKKLLCAIIAILLLTGCGKTITCGECGETKKGKTYTITFLGTSTEEDICDDCIKNAKPIIEALGGTVE